MHGGDRVSGDRGGEVGVRWGVEYEYDREWMVLANGCKSVQLALG